ncbi:Multidrug resistance-associated protein 5 [Phlyctochytrium bullatum]|nr:Multidrug resistance-associated protein 5 [Phlyctochytrium bullatum]
MASAASEKTLHGHKPQGHEAHHPSEDGMKPDRDGQSSSDSTRPTPTSSRSTFGSILRTPWSFLTSSYMNGLIRLSLKRPLEASDLPRLAEEDQAAFLRKKMEGFERRLAEYQRIKREGGEAAATAKPPSLLYPIIATSWSDLAGHIFSKAVGMVATLLLPFVLRALVIRAQVARASLSESPEAKINPETPSTHKQTHTESNPILSPTGVPFPNSAVGLSFFLFFLLVVLTVSGKSAYAFRQKYLQRASSMMTLTVLAKAFRLSNQSRRHFSEGEILSYIGIDIQRMTTIPLDSLSLVLSTAFMAAALSVLSYLVGGAAVVPVVVVVVGSISMMLPLGSLYTKTTLQYTQADDDRVSFLRDVLSSIKSVKLRAVEEDCLNVVGKLRGEQVKQLKRQGLVSQINLAVFLLPQILLPAAVILLYSRDRVGEAMDPAVVFPVLTHIESFFGTPSILANSVVKISIGLKGLDRLREFFLSEERPPPPLLPPSAGPVAVRFSNATLFWEESHSVAGLRAREELEQEEAAAKSDKPDDEKDPAPPTLLGPSKSVRIDDSEDSAPPRRSEPPGVARARAMPSRSMTLPASLSQPASSSTPAPKPFESRLGHRKRPKPKLYVEVEEDDDESGMLRRVSTKRVINVSPQDNDVSALIRVASSKRMMNGTEDLKRKPTVRPPPPLFEKLNLEIPAGKLTVVVGCVGSGKSSLLSAILGEMTLVSGSVTAAGRIAFCEQQPWLLSQSIRANILLGLPCDTARLNAALRAAALFRDLDAMERGLDTVVGEKGVTLSGGQKARVALARAVYQDAEVYLLDDPLAALDASVGREVWDECVVGALKGKTRVLVTHQLYYVEKADRVVVMEGGKVVEFGKYKSLIAKGGALAKMMAEYGLKEKVNGHPFEGDMLNSASTMPPSPFVFEVPALPPAPTFTPPPAASSTTLTNDTQPVTHQPESRKTGALELKVLRNYIGMAGGWPLLIALASLWLLCVVFSLGSKLWLTWWTEDDRWGLSSQTYALGYGILATTHVLFVVPLTALVLTGGLKAAVKLHDQAVAAVFSAKMNFFESQTTLKNLSNTPKKLGNTPLLFSATGALLYATLWGIAFMALSCVIGYFLLKLFRVGTRELKRIKAVERAPIHSHLSDCLAGITCVRAFKAEERMIENAYEMLDRQEIAALSLESLKNWFAIRTDLLSTVATFIVMLVASLTGVSPSLIGLAFEGSAGLTEKFLELISSLSEAEAEFVSAERLLEYIHDLPNEGPRTLPTDPSESAWPTRGAVAVQGLEVRYEGLDRPALHNVTFELRPGEKLGIVGRTGSGKSTLMAALFRLVEPTSGLMTVDGRDLAKLGLTPLRSRLHAIPQDAQLFNGTLRSNLDPYDAVDDARLWAALETVGLRDWVSGLPRKLQYVVEPDGENVSVGQRQLLMLARALCLKPRVLVMDEASSSVDSATELRVAASLAEEMEGTTVICIAHRLHTVAGFDRILVLEEGRIVEHDTPARLLRIEGGYFRKLVDATGAQNAGALEEMALAAERAKAMKMLGEGRQGVTSDAASV